MSSNLDTLLQEAATLGDDGDWEGAHDHLAAALKDYPENPALLCALGVAARHLGADGAAYDYFRRCVAQEPDDPVLLATAGNGLAALDDPDAERVLRLAAVSAPDSAPARIAYGAYLAREGMAESALRELEAAIALGGEHNAEAQRELGLALLLAGRSSQGLQLLEMSEGEGWIDTIRALALLDLGESTEAAELLHELSQAEPSDVELQMLATLACASEGWDDAAWGAFARAELAALEEDRPLLLEVEERLETGPDEARTLLEQELAPSILRERLLQPR